MSFSLRVKTYCYSCLDFAAGPLDSVNYSNWVSETLSDRPLKEHFRANREPIKSHGSMEIKRGAGEAGSLGILRLLFSIVAQLPLHLIIQLLISLNLKFRGQLSCSPSVNHVLFAFLRKVSVSSFRSSFHVEKFCTPVQTTERSI